MLSLLIIKELKALLLSPKLFLSLLVGSLLLLISVITGIREYKAATARAAVAHELIDQSMRQASGWHNLPASVVREPTPMQIFVSGVHYDVGRTSAVSVDNAPKLKNSVYAEDSLFALFRMLDFAFIIQVILSLLAILFTYDAISGEREAGTLQLVFAGAVPRSTYLFGKIIGSWLGLVLPMALAVLLSFLVVILSGVSLAGTDWGRLGLLLLSGLLYVTLFIVLGVAISALTRRPAASFLACLVVWVTFVLIIPRIGVIAANQALPVPSIAQVEGQIDKYSADRWRQHEEQVMAQLREQPPSAQPEDAAGESDDAVWARLEAEEKRRREVESEIAGFEARLHEDLNRRKAEQERLAMVLSRVSPASAFALAAMTLAETDPGMKLRYEDAVNRYRSDFRTYVEKKQEEEPMRGGIMISVSSESGVQINAPRGGTDLDISGLPTFVAPGRANGDILADVLPDFGLLGLYALVAFSLGYYRFLRYDVRPN